MSQLPRAPTGTAFVGLTLANSRPPRLANGEPLGASGWFTLLATAAIILSIVAITPGMGG